jgi:hypothetical protein
MGYVVHLYSPLTNLVPLITARLAFTYFLVNRKRHAEPGASRHRFVEFAEGDIHGVALWTARWLIVSFICKVYALWGGHFNPIIVVDQQERAEELIDVFRVDLILPLGDSELVKQFPKKFSHLINPFFHDNVFVGGERSQVLDIYNCDEASITISFVSITRFKYPR